MNPVAFIIQYTKWHYSEAIFDMLRVWSNFLWLSFHFFSTPTLVRTLFSPFMRIQEDYPEKGHFDPERFLGSLLVNIIMRMVGFIVRTLFIAVSLSLALLVLVSGIIFFVLWLAAPFLIPSLLTVGIDLVL